MVKERKRFRRLVEKVVNLKDEVITQKAEIKVLRSRRREDTPATGITAGLNTLITKKKKVWNTRNAWAIVRTPPTNFGKGLSAIKL